MAFDDPLTCFMNHMQEARRHGEKAEWEFTTRELEAAEALCDTPGFPDVERHRQAVLGELGAVERRLGRFEAAETTLQRALRVRDADDLQRTSILGELGVVYRHENKVYESKAAFQEQFRLANKLALDTDAQFCRAIGNLGVANYQLAVLEPANVDSDLLQQSIKQLEERVRSAQELQTKLDRLDPSSGLVRMAKTWESIGFDRLTLCHACDGNTGEAVRCGERSRALTQNSPDPTVKGFSRFYYGYALLRDGQRTKAMEQWEFTAPDDRCASATSLCKEPSQEYRTFLKVLVDEDVQLDPYDEQGYSALDYAVYSRDSATEALVIEGLRKIHTPDEVNELLREAALRKHYREIFQTYLRPALYQSNSIQLLRRIYADLLVGDAEKRGLFDAFKFVRYIDFAKFGRLPRSDDTLMKEFSTRQQESKTRDSDQYVILFSYRWLGKEDGHPGPDNAHHTQYQRILSAMQAFLDKHEGINPERICLWLVSDQVVLFFVHTRI